MKSVAWYKHLMKKYHSYGSLSPGLGDKSRAGSGYFGLLRNFEEVF